ncbi:hypothetical protein HYH03_005842 [Edaphochlamys debaryana]|uniref:Protein kinase domain-containing protein n=1 Tax=Edaphochlamys debaryana TaxID=47281 RepID=A0A835Y6W2_9CHLO|nr:hypothetical protein HYH03_005842 [Edaphochlamys debaryana]|eukprot:KAG2496244.1 hypothetical protein HYH03_005842 [Edaphochlamys debaryana]
MAPPAFLTWCLGLLADEQPRRPAPKPAKTVTEPEKPKKPPTDWRNLPLVAQYELKELIGKGGFSEIWLSQHRATGEAVAVKVVQLTCADLEPEEVATVLAEAKFLRNLDCPYLLKCRDVGHNDDWLVLVLEYLTGGEVLQHLHKVKRYTESDAARLFAQIVSAISYLHNLNMMHRDLKPENIMFTAPVEESEAAGKPLRIKIIDLGMSAQYNESKPLTGPVGTPGFLPPEVWHDKPHSFAMDVYALGVVLFIMLTGRKPYAMADIKNMSYCDKKIADAPGLQDERFLSLSPTARDLLLRMLADDPGARPSCMDVLHHPFIAAVDSNMDAHREIGDVVRKRMRELAKLSRVHGLQFALRAPRAAAGASRCNCRASGLLLNPRESRLQLVAKGDGATDSRSSADVSVGGSRQRLPPAPTSHGSPAPAATPAPAPSAPTSTAQLSPFARLSGAPLQPPPESQAGPGPAVTPVTTSAQPPGHGQAPARATAPVANRGGGGCGPSAPRQPLSAFAAPAGARQGSAGTAAAGEAATERLRTLSETGGLAGAQSLRRANSFDGPAQAQCRAKAAGARAAAGPDRPPLDEDLAVLGALNAGLGLGLAHCTSLPLNHPDGAALLAGLGAGPGAAGAGHEAEAEPGQVQGGSPVATAELVEQALMLRCMSHNPAVLELLRHKSTLDRLMAEGVVREALALEAAGQRA